jgi:hypothetical protein
MDRSDFLKVVVGALLGGVIALLLNTIAKAWHHAKEINHYRELLLSFINRIGVPLSKQFIEQSESTIRIIECSNHAEYLVMIAGRRLESFPMLNSDLLRSIPMTAYVELLHKRTQYVEIFTLNHCLDFTMEVTPMKAFTEFHEFVTEHTREKAASHEQFVNEFETCNVIATQRKRSCSDIRSRIRRAELNIKFMTDLKAELVGGAWKWKVKYFFQSLV